MKYIGILLVGFSALNTAALATSSPTSPLAASTIVCGILSARAVRPVCPPNQICPRYESLRFFIDDGVRETILVPATSNVLLSMDQMTATAAGKPVCAEGIPQHDTSLVVEQIYLEPFAGAGH